MTGLCPRANHPQPQPQRTSNVKNQYVALDLTSMSDRELSALQEKIYAECVRRTTSDKDKKPKKGKDFLISKEAQELKSEIQSLEAEFSSFPKKIDLGLKVTLKVLAEMCCHASVVEMIQENYYPSGFILELEDTESLPKELKNAIECMVEDINSDYNSAGEFLKNSFDGRQWQAFLQKVSGLDDRLAVLYDAGLDIHDLMEE